MRMQLKQRRCRDRGVIESGASARRLVLVLEGSAILEDEDEEEDEDDFLRWLHF